MKRSNWKTFLTALLCLMLCLALGLAAAGAETAETEKASAKVKITTQPKAASGAVGATVKFTVKASGSKLTYQWEVNQGKGWGKVSGAAAKKATLSVKVKATMNAWKYRVKVTDKNGNTVTSKAVKLTVTPVIKTQPKKTSVVCGKDLKLTVKATGAGLKYQWQYKDFNGKKWLKVEDATATEATLKVTSDIYMYDRQYRCVITDANKKKLTTNAVKITLKGPYNDENFEYEINTNNGTYYQANITNAHTTKKTVTVPKEFGPFPVRGINASSFAENKKIQKVNLQADVWYIGYNAFENCTSLKSITIPSSITNIFPSAFAGCTALKEVDLSDCVNLEVIGFNAFENCTSLKTVYMYGANKLTDIADWAFKGCSKLDTVTLPDNVTNIGFSAFHDIKGHANLNAGTSTMQAALNSFLRYHIAYKDYGIQVENMDDGFACVNLAWGGEAAKEVTIPEGIEKITANVFEGWKNLKTVNLPSTLQRIESAAFQDCAALESINLERVMFIYEAAFKNCTSLKEIALSDNLDIIGESAFENCKALSVFLPDNIQSIGFSAFSGLGDFAISFNANTPTMTAAMQTWLNYDIWYDAYHLWVQNQDSGKYEGYAVLVNSFVNDGKKPTSIEIPEGIETIAMEACASNGGQYSNVKTVKLPSTVGILDAGAFRDCTGLESINLDRVYVIGDSAFANCAALGEVTLRGEAGDVEMQGGFKGIGPNAFSGCTSLNLRVVQGTYAETYAQEHDIPYTTY